MDIPENLLENIGGTYNRADDLSSEALAKEDIKGTFDDIIEKYLDKSNNDLS